MAKKIILYAGPTKAAKAVQKSPVPARQTQQTHQGKTPFICTPRVPICLSFNGQQGPPFSSISGHKGSKKNYSSHLSKREVLVYNLS